MIQRAVISDSRFSLIFLYFDSIHHRTTIIVSPPLHHAIDIQRRSHPTTRSYATQRHTAHYSTIKPPPHYRLATAAPRHRHPTALPSNDPLIRHTTPYCSLLHHQTAPTVNKHRVDTVSTRAKGGAAVVRGFSRPFLPPCGLPRSGSRSISLAPCQKPPPPPPERGGVERKQEDTPPSSRFWKELEGERSRERGGPRRRSLG